MRRTRAISIPWEWDLAGLPVTVEYYYYPADKSVGTADSIEIVKVMLDKVTRLGVPVVVDMLPVLSSRLLDYIEHDLIALELEELID